MLQANQQAPAFECVDQDNQIIASSSFLGDKNIVLYFYPKDDTPGCTIEANEFTANSDRFAMHDTVIIGVSKDDCASHRAFIDKYDLNVILLADTTGELCEAFGVWQEKEKDGVKKPGIVRSTFVIDKSGRLTYVEYGVDPNGHADAVLEAVRNL